MSGTGPSGERVAAIEVEGLARDYDGAPALRGVSFRVEPGEVCGYLGPNGAGKSTTMKILAGLLRPSAGRARIAGHDVRESPLEAKRCLGYVPESGALYTLLSVVEHLNLVADLHDLDPAAAADRMERFFALFRLGDLAHRRIDSLSKGQRQKVALLAGLLPDPPVLLLDEPLHGLDAKAARVVRDLLAGLAARGRAVLYSSHILDVVERVCTRVVILHEGAIVADAPTGELLGGEHDATLETVFHRLTRSPDEVDAAAGTDLFLEGEGGGREGEGGA